MSGKTALITGITGQDGSYLADFLLEQGYQVLGMVRRSSTVNFDRITHLQEQEALELVQGDLLDQMSLIDILQEYQPDEVYNLAAQSFVPTSWRQPVLTGEFTALGVTRMLDAIRIVNPEIRFYQASSSEMFGKVREVPQNESTPFYPRSPYGVAKVYGHWITINYREAYNIFACNGILFNHESPLRGETFVTRKITRAVARIKLGLQNMLYLGNLHAKRDWGYAGDFVKAMWLILQQDEPDDYVIATGESHSVREFVEKAFQEVEISIEWEGTGVHETGKNAENGNVLVQVDPRYFRPTEVESLLGDSSKARSRLGWKPEVSFDELVKRMVREDLKEAERDQLCENAGFRTFNHFE